MDGDEEFKELCHRAGELLVNIGIINSISGRWPKDVQENWAEKIEGINEKLSEFIGEAQEFASALD